MVAVTTSPHVAVVGGTDAFADLRQEWNALLRDSDADCPFLTWEWLHAWWTHLHGGSRLHIVTVRAGSTLIGVAPLRATRSLGVFPQLEFLATGYAGSDYLDVIVRRGYEHVAAGALAEVLEADATTLHLRHLPAASTASLLSEKLVSRGWTRAEGQMAVCRTISLAGHTWDSYLGELSSSHRANVRRRIRGLERGFGLRFHEVHSEIERADAMKALFRFHQARWGDRSTAFTTDSLRAFHDDVSRRALGEGWLRLYVMTLDRATAGVMYGFVSGGTFFFYQHACDERYQPQSAGLALMGLTIRSAIDEGLQTFDMLYGDESYKCHWAREHRPLMALQLFPGHIGAVLHRRTLDAERTAKAAVSGLWSLVSGRTKDQRPKTKDGDRPLGDRRAA